MVPDQLNDETAVALEQFESEWQSGSVPDVSSYAGRSQAARFLSDLIEIDLEYRWRRFTSSTGVMANAAGLLPAFPLLEDYAALLPPDRRADVLNPHMIAAEYRVRTQWGDRPEKEPFLERLPNAALEIETALNEIDTEFDVEDVTPGRSDSSQSVALASTIAHRPPQEQESRSVRQGDYVDVRPPAGKRLGRYHLECLIGRGGFGEVWKAWDPELRQTVAVKILRADAHLPSAALSDLLREGREIARLRGTPGIVTVFDTGECEGRPYIVSEYIEGENLEQRMKGETYSHGDAARLIADAAAALHGAHLKGVVHRDVKPANILLDADGKPCLVDFGLAVSEEELLGELPQAVGTFAYMSPEQARGESHLADPRSDVYSLGVVLYRMLTGRLPFVWRSFDEFKRQLREREPRPLRAVDSSIPRRLEQICLKCLNPSINDRYTTALELAEDLQKWQREQSQRIKPRWIAAAVLGLCAVGVGAAVAIPQLRPQRPDAFGRVPAAGETISWKNPQVVTWAPYNLNDRHAYDPLSRRYHFNAFGHALFQATDLRAGEAEIETTFDLKDWEGWAGVFWGLNSAADGDLHCWSVMAGRHSESGPSRVQISELIIAARGSAPAVYSTKGLRTPIRCPVPPGDRAVLKVRVNVWSVEQIWLNGAPLLEQPFPLPEAQWNVLADSGSGFCGFMGTASILDFKVTQ